MIFNFFYLWIFYILDLYLGYNNIYLLITIKLLLVNIIANKNLYLIFAFNFNYFFN